MPSRSISWNDSLKIARSEEIFFIFCDDEPVEINFRPGEHSDLFVQTMGENWWLDWEQGASVFWGPFLNVADSVIEEHWPTRFYQAILLIEWMVQESDPNDQAYVDTFRGRGFFLAPNAIYDVMKSSPEKTLVGALTGCSIVPLDEGSMNVDPEEGSRVGVSSRG